MENEPNIASGNVDKFASLKTFWKEHPVISVLVILFIVGFVVSSTSDTNGPVRTATNPVVVKSQSEKAVPTPRDIRVTSQTVKEVDGKYRYFFDIRNHDSLPLEAVVTIELLKSNGSVIGKDTFTPTKPIEPGYGDSVYFDINTGPMPQYNLEFAVVGFRFQAEIDGDVVAEGEGKI